MMGAGRRDFKISGALTDLHFFRCRRDARWISANIAAEYATGR